MASGEEFKTTFQTHSGHYEYNVMPFGLAGAPATFLGAMNDTLKPVLRRCALVFFDDILIYSHTLEDHVKHLKEVFQLLKNDSWNIKKSKCSFAQRQLSYLGYIISEQGIATEPEKIHKIQNWPVPLSVKDLRRFLGLAGYYRKFILHYGIIAKPLTQLLRKNTPFMWTSVCDEAFKVLKQCLVSAPVLALPNFQKPFVIETDASEIGIGAILQQEGHPLAYISKALGPRSKGLSTYEKELMAVLFAVEHWRPYLQVSEFTIKTDHRSLVHLEDQRLHTPWQQQAFTKLLGLRYKLCYKKGIDNGAADALSRRPCNDEDTLAAISFCQPTWLKEIKEGYRTDPRSSKIIQDLSRDPNSHTNFVFIDGVLKHKGKIWVGHNKAVQDSLLQAGHDTTIGGHSGAPATYQRLHSIFSWPVMQSAVKTYVQSCQICQQVKPDRHRYPGLLEPLPTLDKA